MEVTVLTQIKAARSSWSLRGPSRPGWIIALLAFCWSAGASLLSAQDAVTRVSVGPGGAQADGASSGAALSADGRFIAFYSDATTLVADDTNGVSDVFVHDRITATTTRVSVGPGGEQANGGSWRAALSADGRFVAFHSDATNLVTDDTNGVSDVFVHDRVTGTTTRVSAGPEGEQANNASRSSALSADGRFVVFDSDATNLVPGDDNAASDVFVHDRQTGTTTRVSVDSEGAGGNGASGGGVISADGRFVAFTSYASNLVADDPNGLSDVFVRDRLNATTTSISGGWDLCRSHSPAISADGRFVAYVWYSVDDQLPPFVYVFDRQTGTETWIGEIYGDTLARQTGQPSISADGRFVAYAYTDVHWGGDGWHAGSSGAMVYDRDTAASTLVASNVGGTAALAISADGRFVAFVSGAGTLVQGDTNASWDVFLRDGAALGKSLPVNGAIVPQFTNISDSLSWLTPWLSGTDATSCEYCFDTVDDGVCNGFWYEAGRWVAAYTHPGTTYFWQVRNGSTYADGGVWWSLTTALSPGKVIALSGNLAFGNVTVGAIATRTLTIDNWGSETLTVSSISYPTGFTGEWSGTIPPGGSQDVTVSFAPSAATTYGGTVTVNGDQASGRNTIAASGTGTPIPTRIIGLGGDLAFGTVTVGTSVTRTLTISNSGNTDLAVASISYPAGFSGSWSGTIPASGSHDVSVTFAPAETGSYSGTVTVNGNQTSGTNTIAASGTATPLVPSHMDFDGDGWTDLIWRNRITGGIVFWLMNGTSVGREIQISGVSDRAWRIVAAADFNDDGKPDLVMRHATTGEDQILLMDGTTRGGTLVLPTVGDQRW